MFHRQTFYACCVLVTHVALAGVGTGCGPNVDRARGPVDPDRDLRHAVATHDAGATLKALKAGADPNKPYAEVGGCIEGFTPLAHAITTSNAWVIDALLRPGSGLDAADINGPIPVQCPELPDTGVPPLAFAAMVGNHMVVHKLLEEGAELEARTAKRGKTPLMWAAHRGHSGIVHILLDAGADIEAAVKIRHPETEDLLGTTAVMYAAGARDLYALRVLLDRGADATKVNGGGASALHFAVSDWGRNDLARVSWLIEAGAPVDTRARWANGRTPLMLAVGGWGSVDLRIALARRLIKAGADPMAADDQGNTLLHFIDFYDEEGDAEHIVRFLIDLGLDPNVQNAMGETPLHIIGGAMPWLGLEALRLLLEAGANPMVQDRRGETPVDRVRALKEAHLRVEPHLRLLEEHAAQFERKQR